MGWISARAWTLAVALLALAGATLARAEDDRSYVLATATTGGTYHPVGVALATLVNVKLAPQHHLSMSAISSAGSGENLELLRANRAQFALLQGLFGAWAWHGTGSLAAAGKQTRLRSITMLWQNVEHFVVARDMAPTGTIDDLAGFGGARFSLGAGNSGAEGSARTILEGLGIDPEQVFEVADLDHTRSAMALRNGTVKGANLPGGVPVGAVTQALLARGDQLVILDFTDQQLARANRIYALWPRYQIPAGTYPGQIRPVMTIAQPNFLAVRADVPDEDVYLITKAIYDNLRFLNRIHAATRAMALDHATAGLPMPLHPGAARFYQEHDLTVPGELLPPA